VAEDTVGKGRERLKFFSAQAKEARVFVAQLAWVALCSAGKVAGGERVAVGENMFEIGYL